MGLFNKKYIVKVRTSNNYHTATLIGDSAKAIIKEMSVSNVSYPSAVDKNKKIIRLEEDLTFYLGFKNDGVKIMLFKGYYLTITTE